MRLSNAAKYAIYAMVHMAGHQDNAMRISRTIALEEGLPDLYLMKVLRPLVTRGILRSIKGPNGGYHLARAAREITLLDIIEAVDGPIRGYIPFEGESAHGLERKLQAICDQAAEESRRHLRKVRLSDLTAKR